MIILRRSKVARVSQTWEVRDCRSSEAPFAPHHGGSPSPAGLSLLAAQYERLRPGPEEASLAHPLQPTGDEGEALLVSLPPGGDLHLGHGVHRKEKPDPKCPAGAGKILEDVL